MTPAFGPDPVRVYIAKPGLDGHDVGAKLVCRALRDAGMEVLYSGLRQAPEAIAAAVRDEDVECLGLSVLSGAHLPLCRAVAASLEAVGRLGEVVWVVGGNIPARDVAALRALGVDGVFPTGADFGEITRFIQEQVSTRRGA